MQHADRQIMNPNNMTASQLLSYGLKLPTPTPALAHLQASGLAAAASAAGTMSPSPMDLQRAQQLYDYNARLQYMRAYNGPPNLPYHIHPHEALAHAFFAKQLDPRTRFLHEEPKPAQSYIGLISMAILQHKDQKLVLADIYQWIMDNFPYFRNRGPGWRNSIRHNLSLNDCFIKSGRSANGKGHYWAIHPANKEDFKRGDFRRRRAQRKVRKAMGLAVPDDEDDSPSPPPTTSTLPDWSSKVLGSPSHNTSDITSTQISPCQPGASVTHSIVSRVSNGILPTTRKRLFDVESLLAPDNKSDEETFNEKIPRLSIESNNSELNQSEDDEEDALLDVCDTDDETSDLDKSRPGPGIIVIEPTCPEEDKQKEMEKSSQLENCNNSYHEEEGDSDSCQESNKNETHRDSNNSINHTDSRSTASLENDSFCPQKTPNTPTSSPSSHLSPSPPETRVILPASPLITASTWNHHHSHFGGNGKPGFPATPNPGMAAAMLAANSNPSTNPNPALWSTLPGSIYPMLGAPFPLNSAGGSGTLSPADQAQAAQRWHETVSRIMARSYEKNVKMEA